MNLNNLIYELGPLQLTINYLRDYKLKYQPDPDNFEDLVDIKSIYINRDDNTIRFVNGKIDEAYRKLYNFNKQIENAERELEEVKDSLRWSNINYKEDLDKFKKKDDDFKYLYSILEERGEENESDDSE